MSYRKLEVWQLSREVVLDIHKLTMALPKFEFYEEGSQIRRSSKSVKSNITEGYGRRRYNSDYLRFLIYAISSNDETIDHLENLYETGSIKNEQLYKDLRAKLDHLGRKLNKLISAIEKRGLNQ